MLKKMPCNRYKLKCCVRGDQAVGVWLFRWLWGVCASSGLGSAPSCKGLWEMACTAQGSRAGNTSQGQQDPRGASSYPSWKAPTVFFPLSSLGAVRCFMDLSQLCQGFSTSLIRLKKFTICTNTINLRKGLCSDQPQCEWFLHLAYSDKQVEEK